MTILNIQKYIQDLINSNLEFPVNLSKVWEVLGYRSEDFAEEILRANFVELVDYVLVGSETYLCLDSLKGLALLNNSEGAKELRLRLLSIEKNSGGQSKLLSPQDVYSQALGTLEDEEVVIEEVEPLSRYQVIGDTTGCTTISKLAKDLKVGPLNLFKFLYKEGLLLSHNVVEPIYQQYFSTIKKYNPSNRDSYQQVLVNPLGVDLIIKKLKAAGYIIPKAA